MEYRKLKPYAHRSPRRALILRDIDSLLELLDEEPDNESELLEEMASLREAVNDLESVMLRACEGIEEVAALLHDALNPTLFPEPLRYGPPAPEQELSYNGLIDFSCREDDVPF
jgi:hypothetical protein